MSTLTFILVLVLSISVYAKTEASLKVPGFPSTQKQSRKIAESTVNDMSRIMDQLNKMNGKPSAKTFKQKDMGFNGDAGAFTRKDKKNPAVTSGPTAESTK